MLRLAASRETAVPYAYSIRDAASVAKVSASWIRTLRACGALEAVEIDGRQAVTSESLHLLIADVARKRAVAEANRSAARAMPDPFAGFPRVAFINPEK